MGPLLWALPVQPLEWPLPSLVCARKQLPQAAALHEVHGQNCVSLRSMNSFRVLCQSQDLPDLDPCIDCPTLVRIALYTWPEQDGRFQVAVLTKPQGAVCNPTLCSLFGPAEQATQQSIGVQDLTGCRDAPTKGTM